MDLTTEVLASLGALTVAFIVLQTFRLIWLYTRPSSLDRYHYGKEPWALVTDARDDIDKALATELARNRFNVVLHGRNCSKLERVMSKL